MSEEEKKAIEYLENQDNSLNWNYGTLQAIKTVLNIIEKYENYEYNKALIQENNDLKIRISEQQKEIEDLKQEQAKRHWVHIKENGEVEPLFYISKEKIREKIKELDSHIWKDGYMTKFDRYAKHYLNELLEEE